MVEDEKLDESMTFLKTMDALSENETVVDAYIKALVDAAPPLTAEQRDRLAVLLRPS